MITRTDAAGRLVQRSVKEGEETQTLDYHYDVLGRLVRITDSDQIIPLGNEAVGENGVIVYDAAYLGETNRVTSETRADGGTVTYTTEYGAGHAEPVVTSANYQKAGQTWPVTMETDTHGRQRVGTQPNIGKVTREYDGWGRSGTVLAEDQTPLHKTHYLQGVHGVVAHDP